LSAAKRKWRKTAGLKFRILPWFSFTRSLESCSSFFDSLPRNPFQPLGATAPRVPNPGTPSSESRAGFFPEFQIGGFPPFSRRRSQGAHIKI